MSALRNQLVIPVKLILDVNKPAFVFFLRQAAHAGIFLVLSIFGLSASTRAFFVAGVDAAPLMSVLVEARLFLVVVGAATWLLVWVRGGFILNL